MLSLEPGHVFLISLVAGSVLAAETVYLLFASSDAQRRNLNRRMTAGQAGKTVSQRDILVQLRKERGLNSEGQFLLPVEWLNRLVVQAGLTIGIGRVLAIWAGFAIVATLAALFVSRSLLVGLGVLPVAGFLLPYAWLRRRRAKVQLAFGRQLPEAVDLITRSLKAGHPVPVAIAMVGREMPDPIGSEFGMVADEVTYGSDLVTALANMFERVGHPDLPLLVSAVSIQSTTGGNLREILDSLSKVIRDRLKMKAKVRAISAEGRLSAIILTAMPVLLLGALLTLMPAYYSGIWDKNASWYGAIGLLTWITLGNLMILKLVSFRV